MTYSLRKLNMQGFRQERIPNTFFEQQEIAQHAAIVFPGRNYSCQGPVLHYPSLELLAQGADVLWVNYEQHPEYTTFSTEQIYQCCTTDAEAACKTLLQHRQYQQLTLIGKSLGTIVLGHLLTSRSFPIPVRAIWLTPLLHVSRVHTQMQQATVPSLYVVGTADEAYDAKLMQSVEEKTKGRVIAIEGANHSLEIGTDVYKSLEAMKQIIQGVQSFPL